MQPRVTFNSGAPSYPTPSLPYSGIATSPANISTVPYNNNLRTSGIISNPGVVVGGPSFPPTSTYVGAPAVRTSGVIATPPPQLATTTFARPPTMTGTVVSTPPVALQRSTVAVAPTTVVAAPAVQQVVQTIAPPPVRQVVAQPVQQQVIAPPVQQSVVHQVAASPPPQPIYVDEPVYVPAPKKKKFWCSPLFWALLGLLGLIGLTLGLLFAFGVLGGKGGDNSGNPVNTTYKIPPSTSGTTTNPQTTTDTVEPIIQPPKTQSANPANVYQNPQNANPSGYQNSPNNYYRNTQIPAVEEAPVAVRRYHDAEQSHKLRVTRAGEQ